VAPSLFARSSRRTILGRILSIFAIVALFGVNRAEAAVTYQNTAKISASSVTTTTISAFNPTGAKNRLLVVGLTFGQGAPTGVAVTYGGTSLALVPGTSATNGNRQPGGTGILGSAPYGTNLNAASYNNSQYHGFRSRANISWHVTDDMLLYYTWSQGFRPGGFNRGIKYNLPDATGAYQYATPSTYRPDTLINNEFGFKTEWLNHRLQVNGAVYQEDWKNTIVEFFDPQQGFGNLTFVTNGPNYKVRGGELQVVARVTEGLTLQSSASYNRSSQANSPSLSNNNPASPSFGKPVLGANGEPIPNVFGVQGSPLGESPEFQGNLRLRYEFAVGEYKAFSQIGGQYYGRSFSTVGTVDNYEMGGWATVDASVGASKDAWNVQFFAQNLMNRDASVYTNAAQFILTQVPLRPRIAGVQFGYKF